MAQHATSAVRRAMCSVTVLRNVEVCMLNLPFIEGWLQDCCISSELVLEIWLFCIWWWSFRENKTRRHVLLMKDPPNGANDIIEQWMVVLKLNFPGRIISRYFTWTIVAFLSIGPSGGNISEIWIRSKKFSFMKIHFKMSHAKYHPFRSILSVLKQVNRWASARKT